MISRSRISRIILVSIAAAFAFFAVPASAACPQVGSCGALAAPVSPMPIGDLGQGVFNWQPNNFEVMLSWSAAANIDCGWQQGQYAPEVTNPTFGDWRSPPFSMWDPGTTSLKYDIFGGLVNDPDPIGCVWQFRVHALLLDTSGNQLSGPLSSVSVYIPGPMGAAGNFSATASSKGITVSWQPPPARLDGNNTPIPVKGYNIYRSVSTGDDSLVASVGATAASWTDGAVIAGKTYDYTIYPFDAYSYGQFSTASAKATAVQNGLREALLKPFASCANGFVDFAVNRETRVSVEVFDLAGKQIAAPVDGVEPPGVYHVALSSMPSYQLVLVTVRRGDVVQSFETPLSAAYSRMHGQIDR